MSKNVQNRKNKNSSQQRSNMTDYSADNPNQQYFKYVEKQRKDENSGRLMRKRNFIQRQISEELINNSPVNNPLHKDLSLNSIASNGTFSSVDGSSVTSQSAAVIKSSSSTVAAVDSH